MEAATARLSDVPVLVREVWDADTCPSALLPWLAWARTVDTWPPGMSDTQKREAIKAALYVHKHKGTAGAVRAALAALGVPSDVIEWWQESPMDDPFTFRVELNVTQTPVTQSALNDMVDAINRTKNVRSHLTGIRPGVTTRADLSVAGVSLIGSEITVGFEIGPLLVDGAPVLADGAPVSFVYLD